MPNPSPIVPQRIIQLGNVGNSSKIPAVAPVKGVSRPAMALPSQLARLGNSRALGDSIPTIPQPMNLPGDEQLPFVLQPALILNGQNFPVAVAGDFLYVQFYSAEGSLELDSSLNPLKPLLRNFLIAKDSNGISVSIEKSGKGYVFPKAFTKLEFSFTGLAVGGCQILFYAGFGRVQDEHDGQIVVGQGNRSSMLISRPNNVTPYAAGQVVAVGAGTYGLAALVMRNQNGKGVITKCQCVKTSANNVNADFTLFLFGSNTIYVPTADQTPFAPLASELVFLVGIIRLPSFLNLVNSGVCEVDGIQVPYWQNPLLDNPSFALFGVLVANAAYVPSAQENFTFNLFADNY